MLGLSLEMVPVLLQKLTVHASRAGEVGPEQSSGQDEGEYDIQYPMQQPATAHSNVLALSPSHNFGGTV